ncbi:hypothetical protein BC828DRAFT_4010 [Blastocladiella britannica]|nr:hypothetical protein BC828DRAFT_4010 [Blastocladiella britannica]
MIILRDPESRRRFVLGIVGFCTTIRASSPPGIVQLAYTQSLWLPPERALSPYLPPYVSCMCGAYPAAIIYANIWSLRKARTRSTRQSTFLPGMASAVAAAVIEALHDEGDLVVAMAAATPTHPKRDPTILSLSNSAIPNSTWSMHKGRRIVFPRTTRTPLATATTPARLLPRALHILLGLHRVGPSPCFCFLRQQ